MIRHLLIATILVTVLISCNRNRRIRVDDFFVEGDISKDTIYNGPISFYDTGTNTLTEVINYKNGVLEGERTGYFKNGKTNFKAYYKNGKLVDDTKTYDSAGNLLFRQNYYYGLNAGASSKYRNNQMVYYYFYSLENQELFHLDYDSISGKTVEQLQNGNDFFFWRTNKYLTPESQAEKTALFLYVPDPPKLNFKYSLCVIDSLYNVKRNVKNFLPNEICATADLDYTSLQPDEIFAIRLETDNEFVTDRKKTVLFKKI
jgi:hypothetical protein